MQKYCPSCACALRGLRMRCPDCRRSTIGWLHVALIAALDAAGLVYLMKLT
jgi:ribosomal protein S26